MKMLDSLIKLLEVLISMRLSSMAAEHTDIDELVKMVFKRMKTIL